MQNQIGRFVASVAPFLIQKRVEYESTATYDLTCLDDLVKQSDVRIAYVLPLMHFLNAESISYMACAVFEDATMIKTTDGVDGIQVFMKAYLRKNGKGGAASPQMQQDEINYIHHKFGKCWWKIPKNDYQRAKDALKATGKAKVVLIDIEETEFPDRKTGEDVHCLIPKLKYIPVDADEEGDGEEKEEESQTQKKEPKRKAKKAKVDKTPSANEEKADEKMRDDD